MQYSENLNLAIFESSDSTDLETFSRHNAEKLEEEYLRNKGNSWQNFSWTNSSWIGTTQSSYTLNKWRVKNDILFIAVGIGKPDLIDEGTEAEVARIPIKGNTSFNSEETRIWNGAVGAGGAYGGFFVKQNSNHISVYIKPHTTSQGQSTKWFSSHFAIPLDDDYEIVS